MLGVSGGLAAEPPQSRDQAETVSTVFLAIVVNDQPVRFNARLISVSGLLHITGDDLRKIRMNVPANGAFQYRDREYYPLDELPGVDHTLDDAAQTLHLEARSDAFEGTEIESSRWTLAEPSAGTGGVLNYDLTLSRADDDTQFGGFGEVVAFTPGFTAANSFLVRSNGDDHLVRLDTRVARDRPDKLDRFVLGDAISFPGSIGRAVRFAGVQWASDFTQDPTFIPFTRPGIAGESALPSTVEVYVNDLLTFREDVPAGPFSIDELPVVTGAGDVRMVVTDLLGREQVVALPFYASRRILAPGISEFAYELGALRRNFGSESFDYDTGFARATRRYGLNRTLTGELQAEGTRDHGTLGLAATRLIGETGVLELAVAGSRHRDAGNGLLAAVGFERISRTSSLGFRVDYFSEDFVQLGRELDRRRLRLQARLNGSLFLRRAGSIGFALVEQRQHDDINRRFLTLNYSRRLPGGFALRASVTRIQASERDHVLAVTLTRRIGNRTSASSTLRHSERGDQASLSVLKSPPRGRGGGYLARADRGLSDRVQATGIWQEEFARFIGEIDHGNGNTAYRAGMAGGIAFLGGGVFPSRRLDQSFAVIDAAGYSGVTVYHENHPVATTNSRGLALVPGLRPWEPNRIRLDQRALPLEVELGESEIEVVPRARSGVFTRFPAYDRRGVTLRLVRIDGRPVPAGATARWEDTGEEFPVGMDGLVYATGLGTEGVLLVRWNGTACSAHIVRVDTGGAIPDLGDFRCEWMDP